MSCFSNSLTKSYKGSDNDTNNRGRVHAITALPRFTFSIFDFEEHSVSLGSVINRYTAFG